jgi:hypothetical protein
MVEKVGIASAKLCTAQCIFCVQNTKHKQKTKFKSFLHWVERCGYQKSRIQLCPVLMNCNDHRGTQCQGGLNRTPNAHCSGISSNTNGTKLLLVGRTRQSILHDSVKDVWNIKSKVKLRKFVNSALFCFTNGLVLRDITH